MAALIDTDGFWADAVARRTAVKLAQQNVIEIAEMDEDAATQVLRMASTFQHNAL